MSSNGQIGILGGSFDPVHWGHLQVAQQAMRQVSLRQVIWVPSGSPPHKPIGMAHFSHRTAMIRAAIAHSPAFSVSEVEANSVGLSYAIETFLHLQAQHPGAEWYWILGADTFQTLPRWYRWTELAQSCQWLVAPRSSTHEASVQATVQLAERRVMVHWQWLDMPFVDLSSRQIRQRCQMGQPIAGLVPDAVQQYIAQHRLYVEPQTSEASNLEGKD